MRRLMALALLVLAACNPVVTSGPPVVQAPPVATTRSNVPLYQVVDRVMPVAVQACRERGQVARCDYAVVLDERPGAPPNAFQTVSQTGQPIIGFTAALVEETRNADELAFILSHEAAHHIEGHLARGQVSAQSGAVLAGTLVRLGGGDDVQIRRAQDAGAFIGARQFAKGFELEADAVGTILTLRAGYDPIRGVQYFYRIPDPGNQFLGTHPPNAERIAIVQRTAAQYR